MPQPAANDIAAQALIRVYEDSYRALLAEYEAMLATPNRSVRAARLRELLRSHEATMAVLNEATRTWMATTLPALHAAGAAASADALGTAFRWTMTHRSAVEDYATRTWEDIAARLRSIDRETRLALRGEVKAATRSALLDGKTAQQAGRDVAREAARGGLWSVEYSNGARHTMRDYADSVIRTTTAESYNRGSVVQCVEDGIEWVEYADGTGCGVHSHNDGEEANGLIVKIEDVVYLSHPRCRRAILPAPFARPLSEGVDRDVGPERDEGAPVVDMREPRSAREPREPRSARMSGDE